MRKVIGLIIVAIISLTKTVDHQATINDVSACSAILMDAGSGRVMFQKIFTKDFLLPVLPRL